MGAQRMFESIAILIACIAFIALVLVFMERAMSGLQG